LKLTTWNLCILLWIIKESNLNNSENKSNILNLVVTDTIRLSRVSNQDKPFNESIVGEWNHIINNSDLIIQRDGQIDIPLLKPRDKEGYDGKSYRWSRDWWETHYYNTGRYVINTDSSLTITFKGITTHREEYQEGKYGSRQKRVLSKSETSTVKTLVITNVFNNYLFTDVGVFKKELSE